jgi:hypothetical protein
MKIREKAQSLCEKRTRAFKKNAFFIVLFISASENLKGMFLWLARFS